jgi:hypothetical protein
VTHSDAPPATSGSMAGHVAGKATGHRINACAAGKARPRANRRRAKQRGSRMAAEGVSSLRLEQGCRGPDRGRSELPPPGGAGFSLHGRALATGERGDRTRSGHNLPTIPGFHQEPPRCHRAFWAFHSSAGCRANRPAVSGSAGKRSSGRRSPNCSRSVYSRSVAAEDGPPLSPV